MMRHRPSRQKPSLQKQAVSVWPQSRCTAQEGQGRLTDCGPSGLSFFTACQLGLGLDDNKVIRVRDGLTGLPLGHPIIPKRVVGNDVDLALNVPETKP